jgi:carbonic anhydrase
MITSERITSDNRHIESLEHLFQNASTAINWLVIAHDESQMVDSLSSALSGQSAAILRVPQDTWDFAESELSELIEWALQQGKLENIALVGHSNAAKASRTARSVPPVSDGERKTSEQDLSNRLVAGARRSSAGSRQARQLFTDRMQQLSQIPVVHNRWANGELAIYGLFYQAESAMFLAYDVEEGKFRPLVS